MLTSGTSCKARNLFITLFGRAKLLRAYDYGVSQSKTCHNANWKSSSTNSSSTPFSSDQAISHYMNAGVSQKKLIIGMPLYGRSYTGTLGPGAPFSGMGEGKWEPGVYDYKDLPMNGSSVYSDAQVVASWTYDKTSLMMVSFDSAEITVMKAHLIAQHNLGGAMWWEASGDASDNRSLISTVGLTHAL